MDEVLPTLDTGVLAELRRTTGNDDAFLLELVEAYLGDGERQLAEAERALASRDTEAFVINAHTLKSTSASVGALRLAEICRRIEQLGRAGVVDSASELVGQARAEWPATVAALRSALGEDPTRWA